MDKKEIDIELYVKEGKKVPHGTEYSYKFKVDKQHFVVESHLISGREILTLAGKLPPANYRIDQKMKGGSKKKIELEDIVNLAERLKNMVVHHERSISL